MFKCLLRFVLVGLPLMASANETVWWRTSGASVLQDADTCSLYLINKTQAMLIAWKGDDRSIAVQDDHFDFADDEPLAIGVRIDTTDLVGNLVGTGHANTIIVTVQQSLDALLRHAAEVEVKAASSRRDYSMTMRLNRAKMPALMTAVEKCRAALHRR